MAGDNQNEPHVHLNLNIRGMKPSPTVAINERSNELRKQGRRVYKLGLGQSPFPVPVSVVDALRFNAGCKDYLAVKGLPELRRSVADYYRRLEGTAMTDEDVLIGPGSKELMFLLQIVYYGDLVIPSPAWVSYAPQAQIVGRRVSFLHTRAEDGWKLDPQQLSSFCAEDPERPRILILNYPSNPTGGTYSPGELQEIAEVARRHRVVLLSDEIYGELHHTGQHVSVARYYPEGTIISGGLSKWCGAGGWRLGCFLFPPSMRWLQDAMAAVASETFTSTSAPIQFAAVTAFEGGLRIERYLWCVRKILAALGTASVAILREADVRVNEPAGGFYLFPDFTPWAGELKARGITTSAQLCDRLLEETGVAILPGADFGRPPGELTARLSYVDFDGARALGAVETMQREARLDDAFVETYCAPVLAALRAVGAWLRDPAAAAARPAARAEAH